MPRQWTTQDFESLSWHDCHIHGIRIGELNRERGAAEVDLDIDFILQWFCTGQHYRFLIAPATLTFHDVFGLQFNLDYTTPQAGMTPFSIDGIEREITTYPHGHTEFRWRLPISWPSGCISFTSTGFTQTLRGEPIEQLGQCLEGPRPPW